MDAQSQNPSPLPVQIPLFPLQSVLFPGGYLPLRIFEVRYLDMIGRCHKAGTPFGVVCLTEGREVRQPAQPGEPGGDNFAHEAFHEVGTLAEITLLERPQPGLMMIRCTGGQRFRVTSSEKLKHGLWMAAVELLPADAAVPVPDDLAVAARALRQLVEELSPRVDSVADLPLQPPFLWDDCGWLANRWGELLPLGPEQKQRLMTLDNPLLRLELVTDALQQIGLGKRSAAGPGASDGPGAA